MASFSILDAAGLRGTPQLMVLPYLPMVHQTWVIDGAPPPLSDIASPHYPSQPLETGYINCLIRLDLIALHTHRTLLSPSELPTKSQFYREHFLHVSEDDKSIHLQDLLPQYILCLVLQNPQDFSQHSRHCMNNEDIASRRQGHVEGKLKHGLLYYRGCFDISEQIMAWACHHGYLFVLQMKAQNLLQL